MTTETHTITLDTDREDGKQHILNHLFGDGFGREASWIIQDLTGCRDRYPSKDEKKLSSRVRGWLRQLEADGKLRKGVGGAYHSVTTESLAKVAVDEACEEAIEKQSERDRGFLAGYLGSDVEKEEYGSGVKLTAAQLHQIIAKLEVKPFASCT